MHDPASGEGQTVAKTRGKIQTQKTLRVNEFCVLDATSVAFVCRIKNKGPVGVLRKPQREEYFGLEYADRRTI